MGTAVQGSAQRVAETDGETDEGSGQAQIAKLADERASVQHGPSVDLLQGRIRIGHGGSQQSRRVELQSLWAGP